jgi:hypothetical protein
MAETQQHWVDLSSSFIGEPEGSPTSNHIEKTPAKNAD